MSKTKKNQSPCRFVYARERVLRPDKKGILQPQHHVTACVALVPHFRRDDKSLIGIGIGASYRSPKDNPCRAEARKHALKRAAIAIRGWILEGFNTAPVMESKFSKHGGEPDFFPSFAGAYLIDNTSISSLTNMIGGIVFSPEDLERISNAAKRMLKKFS